MAADDRPRAADLALAAALVRNAGDLAARMLRDGLSVQRKTSISDVVSAADHAAEDLVVARLRVERPEDGIIGEEGTADTGTTRTSTRRTWYVDPVDGTYNFLSGLPVWCAALALVETGQDPLGAIYQPTSGELWAGGAGQPTTRNGEPVPPLAERRVGEISVATYLHPTTLPDDTLRRPLLRVMQSAATVRMLGSGSVELASVQVDSLPWDWLPGAALVLGAGGAAEIVETEGHRWHIAGNQRVVQDIAGLLRADP